jgi:hypothetical protein
MKLGPGTLKKDWGAVQLGQVKRYNRELQPLQRVGWQEIVLPHGQIEGTFGLTRKGSLAMARGAFGAAQTFQLLGLQREQVKFDYEAGIEKVRREMRELLVGSAIRESAADFRTIGSLVEETGLTEGDVRAATQSKAIARRPWGRPGMELFAEPSKPVSAREVLSAIRAYIAKRP